MNFVKPLTTACVLFVGSAITAAAHTVSYGYIAGANPGEVDFWFGSYHTGAIPFESQLSLSGVDGTVYGPSIFNFDTTSSTLPTGLTLDDNYFCADTYPSCGTNVFSWMGVTATGLNAGEYVFELQNTSSTTAFWFIWDDSIGAQFTLSSGDIGGGGTNPSVVPLPASMPLLLAGLGGFALFRRKRLKA